MLQRSQAQPRSLSRKVVAITGGMRGIGYATACALPRERVRVGIGDLDGDLTAEVAPHLGQDAFGVGVDVAERAAYAGRLERVKAAASRPFENLS